MSYSTHHLTQTLQLISEQDERGKTDITYQWTENKAKIEGQSCLECMREPGKNKTKIRGIPVTYKYFTVNR